MLGQSGDTDAVAAAADTQLKIKVTKRTMKPIDKKRKRKENRMV